MTETSTNHALVDRNGAPIVTPALHHFGTATTQNDVMYEWYRDVIGLDLVVRYGTPVPAMTFVTSDGAHHRGGFFTPPGLIDHPDKPQHARIQHLAWEYSSIRELLESWKRIKALDIEPVTCVCHGPSFAFYYKDPDNNTVELLTDAFTDRQKGLAYMTSPEMQANPMGGWIDPAKLDEDVEAGVELDELRVRALGGRYQPEGGPGDPMVTW